MFSRLPFQSRRVRVVCLLRARAPMIYVYRHAASPCMMPYDAAFCLFIYYAMPLMIRTIFVMRRDERHFDMSILMLMLLHVFFLLISLHGSSLAHLILFRCFDFFNILIFGFSAYIRSALFSEISVLCACAAPACAARER